jgi:SAM-dependent methyltransferase
MKRMMLNARLLWEHLTGRWGFESSYYRESQLTRLMNLFAHVDLKRWQGMKVLEVGAGWGHIGDVFAQLGFDVTSTDGRREHVERMKVRGRPSFVLDLDRTGVDEVGDFDIIISFGVLYHLTEPEQFVHSCGRKAKVLLLETLVCDATDPVCHRVKEAKGWRGKDQAVNELGCRPSPSWVERTCREAGFDVVRDISSPIGNWVIGKFDWEPMGTAEWRRDGVNLRKMWVCEKSSPRAPVNKSNVLNSRSKPMRQIWTRGDD